MIFFILLLHIILRQTEEPPRKVTVLDLDYLASSKNLKPSIMNQIMSPLKHNTALPWGDHLSQDYPATVSSPALLTVVPPAQTTTAEDLALHTVSPGQ